ncbi:acrosin-like [Falco naumanni]|uniref:acrosin-like n=1 Tax=Falco naumanni TaxID=148594 RepID=UPI001ADE959E|nr:acrosin-like [Falco naumanni]
MSRVVGGTDAQAGAWPWIVSIQNPWQVGTGHTYGGSLINAQWVLTAAHCFIEASYITMWRVVIGATRLTQLGPEAQVRNIKRLLLHQGYSNITQRNDIALLELDQPVQCNAYVQLACVPDASLRVSQLKNCYISGWGATTARSGRSTDVLQEAQVRLIDVNVCNSSRWYRGAIHTHNVCAGYPQGGIDTCQLGERLCQSQAARSLHLHSALLRLDPATDGPAPSSEGYSNSTCLESFCHHVKPRCEAKAHSSTVGRLLPISSPEAAGLL